MKKYGALFLVLIIASMGVSAGFGDLNKSAMQEENISKQINENSESNVEKTNGIDVTSNQEVPSTSNVGPKLIPKKPQYSEKPTTSDHDGESVSTSNRNMVTSNVGPKPVDTEPNTENHAKSLQTYNVVSDSYVRNDLPEENFGSELYMVTGNVNSHGHAYTYLNFEMNGLSEVEFDEAELCIYKQNYMGNGEISLSVILEDWDESTINSNNKPGTAGTMVTEDVVQGWNCLDVTGWAKLHAFLQRFGYRQGQGIMIDTLVEDGNIEFITKEGANQPYIKLA